MAVLENIYHQSMIYNPESPDSKYGFVPNTKSKKIKAFPQIFFSDGEPWKEANQYAFSRFYDSNRDIKTVSREINHLAKYADWLEQEKLHWLHFPKKKRERCLFRFRGFLIECREQHLLAPSTVSQIMSSTVKFYRWASSQGLADSRNQLWDEEFKLIKFFDKQGFSRTMGVLSTELVIPNRKRSGDTLEDGLLPLTQQQVKTLMLHLKTHSNYELYLMHKVALLTGCRYETVTTLTIGVLNNAYQDPNSNHLMRVSVGPSTPVKTKFDVRGEILFPASLIQELADYFSSAQAILRRAKAPEEYQSNIFLTSQGNPYLRSSFSTLIGRLKVELIELGHTEFGRFKFHQLRATFGTMLMKSALNSGAISASNAIEYVKDAMLHNNASTTWKYVKFIEKEPLEEAFLDLLWGMFTGTAQQTDELVDSLTGRYDG
ncbi:MAG: site-specific integrase [Oleispira sp.]|nr:site-specific integrase [Oleispira sp.]MBL4881116.1 site-specific integrase [Oleispira sp.]